MLREVLPRRRRNTFKLRAKSGAAMIAYPETIVDSLGDGIGAKWNFSNKGIVPDITKETEMIHRYGGVSSVCLRYHGGGRSVERPAGKNPPERKPTGEKTRKQKNAKMRKCGNAGIEKCAGKA